MALDHQRGDGGRHHTLAASLMEVEVLRMVKSSSKTLVTLVSHSQLLWRGVTQGGVAPVFPFGANPYLCRHGTTMRYHLCNAAPQ